MRTEYDMRMVWHLIQFFDKYCAFFFQVVNHESIVDDFVADINWCAEQFDRSLDDFDSAINPGAKPAWVGKQYFH